MCAGGLIVAWPLEKHHSGRSRAIHAALDRTARLHATLCYEQKQPTMHGDRHKLEKLACEYTVRTQLVDKLRSQDLAFNFKHDATEQAHQCKPLPNADQTHNG